MHMKTFTVIILPGTGKNQLRAPADQALYDWLEEMNYLTGYTVTIDGQGIDPSQYRSIRMGSVTEIWIAKPVKGA